MRDHRRGLGLALTLAAFALPQPAPAQAPSAAIGAALADADMDSDIRAFYAARSFRPLWLASPASADAAWRLVDMFEQADVEGLDAGDYRPRRLRSALEDARAGSPKDVARAEAMLSRIFTTYVRDLRQLRSPLAMADPQMKPEQLSPRQLLNAVAAAPSLARYVDTAGWAHPLYAQLRRALVAAPERSEEARLLRANLDRVRALPASGRHVVVDTAGGRLYMYDRGRVVDSMRVIAGRSTSPTPMMASMIRYATLNPYWNVPPDLTRERLVPHILAEGPQWLKTGGYDVLSDWSPRAGPTDANLVDWNAVAAGQREVRVRQRPGAGNGMGKMKFMFPNGQDIYLHDTPDKGLFKNDERYFSGGCIRLEDAPRLGRWLFGKPLKATSAKPELRVDLPAPVPIYVTYLTAYPERESVVFRPDNYGRDNPARKRADRL